ncbi:MAG TPA: polysaccharide deacetylase family protein [Candidatus Acidoferrum sp.]|nr:polysaccharide deacetylase family protein [Candidatus Acidoferrum sp.]
MDPWLIGVPTAATLAGATIALGAVAPRSQMFGATLCCTASPGRLAITFDDGPNPAITPILLDLLDRYDAKATFFVIGRFVRECAGLTREIAGRGHVLANHTETHPNLFWMGPAAVRQELQNCQAALHEATGSSAKYFRPPFGFRNPWVVSTARQLGMETVMWTLLPGDWKARSGEWLAARMRPIAQHAERPKRQGAGDVLCLHDGAHRALGGDRTSTLEALEYWLPRWRDLGLKFVTISEAVSLPAR